MNIINVLNPRATKEVVSTPNPLRFFASHTCCIWNKF